MLQILNARVTGLPISLKGWVLPDYSKHCILDMMLPVCFHGLTSIYLAPISGTNNL